MRPPVLCPDKPDGLAAWPEVRTATWDQQWCAPVSSEKVRTPSAGGGAVWGGFWGLLFGLLFFVPFAGWAVGAGLGALFGHLGEKGIDKQFQQQVRDYVKPGTSALFMIIEHATPDKAIAALQQYGGTVVKTSLSDEDTRKLQEALTPPTVAGAA